jgi:hypothetical protein
MKYAMIFLKMMLILMISAFVGAGALFVVFHIPTEPIKEHVLDSASVFELEGTYPFIGNGFDKELDNYTDALMLSNSFFMNEDTGIWDNVISVYNYGYSGSDPTDSLIQYRNGNRDYTMVAYSRYWHGYLAVLKPVLYFTNYLGIRDINMILQSVLLIAALFVIGRYISWKYVLPFLAAMYFLHPGVILYSLQYSTVYYLTLTGSILTVLLFHKDAVWERGIIWFLMIGIVTNYMDFLTYPALSLGVPLVLFVCLQRGKTWYEKMKSVVLCSFGWGLGYGGMWIGKWVLGSIILQKNLFAEALTQVQLRSSSDVSGNTVGRIYPILRNLYYGFYGNEWLAAVLALCLVVVMICVIRKKDKQLLLNLFPLLLVAAIPICWYMALSNHTSIHTFFTYRTLGVSVFAVMAMVGECF